MHVDHKESLTESSLFVRAGHLIYKPLFTR